MIAGSGCWKSKCSLFQRSTEKLVGKVFLKDFDFKRLLEDFEGF